jgi:hypothetical protein
MKINMEIFGETLSFEFEELRRGKVFRFAEVDGVCGGFEVNDCSLGFEGKTGD